MMCDEGLKRGRALKIDNFVREPKMGFLGLVGGVRENGVGGRKRDLNRVLKVSCVSD